MVGLVRWGEADLFKERHGVHKQVDAASKTCGRRKATRSTWKWRRAASRHDEEKISRRAFPSGHHPQSEHYTEIIARHTHESTQQLMQHLSHTLASQKIRPVLSTINYCVCVCVWSCVGKLLEAPRDAKFGAEHTLWSVSNIWTLSAD